MPGCRERGAVDECWLGMELKPATAETRPAGLTVLRRLGAFWNVVDHQEAPSDGPRTGSLGG
jgi:hypothetical protein